MWYTRIAVILQIHHSGINFILLKTALELYITRVKSEWTKFVYTYKLCALPQLINQSIIFYITKLSKTALFDIPK